MKLDVLKILKVGLIIARLRDANGRPLDMYGNVQLGIGESILFSLWVPYWIVNKSGIPLILKQEAANTEAAGQMVEHEFAKDKHPLMFSFADDGCPKQLQSGMFNTVQVGMLIRNGVKFCASSISAMLGPNAVIFITDQELHVQHDFS
ncbi:hypothetical protein DICVIV_05016 [Dictyocaulus viviparus]|uniref:Vacuolar protein sorting-associated protein 13 VPS13 adaptor binding domain-containing protein n=1 Tax=Dictyocaulus viviparus TaxID=29172 RepID=A0A0D8Y2M9_DICVI|nr:hypothetical protein DICVIV_05016 [Dictyocaulus viviparus]